MSPGTPAAAAEATAAADTLAPNPFLIIAPDNTVTVIIKHLDKGQGAATGLATLVAEELDASWEQIHTEFAPSDADKYKNFAFGIQGVGGSTGLSNSYLQYRTAGAAARAMLVAAAARAWGVPASEIKVAKGALTHSGKSATFGEMAQKAAAENVPGTPKLKQPEQFIYIGKSFPRVDLRREVHRSRQVHIRPDDARHAGGHGAASAEVRRQGEELQCGGCQENRGRHGCDDHCARRRHRRHVNLRHAQGARCCRSRVGLERQPSSGARRVARTLRSLLDKPGAQVRTTATSKKASLKPQRRSR